MIALSPEQVAGVRELQSLCSSIGVEAVIIGAVAYRIWMKDWARHTEDVDFAVAVDLDDFSRLAASLHEHGWTHDNKREPRWYTPQKARIDLIPAGPALRRQQELKWPTSGMQISLVGFEQAFAKAVEFRITADLTVKVVPLGVLVLLKIVAYLDNPQEREKDVVDLGAIISHFEPEDALRFSDEVLNASLEYEAVGAYLVGKDLGAICSADERVLVDRFLAQLTDERTPAFRLFARRLWSAVDEESRSKSHTLIEAFTVGFQAR